MIMCILVTALLFVVLVVEIIGIAIWGVHHYIKGNGIDYLQEELAGCRINQFENSIISLNSNSKLNGWIIHTMPSILFPYHFVSHNGVTYGILIFSEAYFITRKKFKELRITNKRLKF